MQTLEGGRVHTLSTGVPAGVYFPTFLSGDQASTKKLVVE